MILKRFPSLPVTQRQGPRLTLGSQTGEQTPQKVVFQLSGSISQSKKNLHLKAQLNWIQSCMSFKFCHFESIWKISQGHCGPLTPFLRFRHLSGGISPSRISSFLLTVFVEITFLICGLAFFTRIAHSLFPQNAQNLKNVAAAGYLVEHHDVKSSCRSWQKASPIIHMKKTCTELSHVPKAPS